ncbi:hypothetical protein HHK36_005071 [Tetracentron sinense]|uniref:EF-hand domain-containing protein n=1 Tax=Tetracentron sinense TaxID=13715 RepID=A0A834ZNU3_TETSI|nr:hypothetical protein HHK36_005071 [Tetracentron sinense]
MPKMAKTIFRVAILLLMAVGLQGRFLRYNPWELVSDGIDHVPHESSYLLLKSSDSSTDCEHMYGFLPCTDNLPGHLFLIVVYEYLLFLGESYVSAGSEILFKILGPGFFGASAFHILGTLPEPLILLGNCISKDSSISGRYHLIFLLCVYLVSGLSGSKDVAQEQIVTGVGLLAGSTILLLTLVWGTCVIVGKCDFSKSSASKDSDGSSTSKGLPDNKRMSSLTGFGITTDLETSYTARIMVLSLIPLVIVQLPKSFNLSSGERVVIVIGLVVSIALLLMYFLYQVFQPWIQKRRLEYVKHENLVVGVLKYVQRHASGRLLTDEGAPNINVIRRIFEKIDQDADDYISPSEFKELIQEIKFGTMHMDKEDAVTDIMKEFDQDGDHKITKDEFVIGFSKWLDEAKLAFDRKRYSKKTLHDLYQVFQPWIKKRRLDNVKEQLIFEVLRYVQSHPLGSLLSNDGTPDIPSIKRLFEEFDLDGDNCLSHSELKELIQGIKFGKIQWDKDEAAAEIMRVLDTNGDHKINEDEFVNGFAKWINDANNDVANEVHQSVKSQDDFHQKTWKETDMLVQVETSGGVVDHPSWAFLKAGLLLLLGIVILSLLAEPLIETVQNFSTAASIPSFYASFVLVPLATKSREAVSAIISASRKKPRTSSLTFSEIYGGVFMNNILCLSVLLAIIYVRELTWDFTAEVLAVLIVCAIMGLVASFRSTFPVWTGFVAYLLYPLSLLLVYVLDYVLGWS